MSPGIDNNLKWGLVLLAIGSETVRRIAGIQMPAVIAPLYILCAGCAMLAVRIDEKAARASSGGTRLPPGRLLQTAALFALMTLGAYGTISYLPSVVTKVVGGIVFTFELVVVGTQIAFILGMVSAAQAGQWLGEKLGFAYQSPANSNRPMSQEAIIAQIRQLLEPEGREITLSPFILNALRYLPLIILGTIVTFLFFYLQRKIRTIKRRATPESEENLSLSVPDILQDGLDRLRHISGMIHRYGVNKQLLAAISIQNIYANLGRIAAQNGHPRHPSTPPDAYLPTLIQVFDGCETELSHITHAYMRVHYGEVIPHASELKNIQQDYHAIRQHQRKTNDRRGNDGIQTTVT
jgi:hypothetical protein